MRPEKPPAGLSSAALAAIAGGPRTVAVSVDMDAPADYAAFYRRPPPAAGADRFLAATLGRLLPLFSELGIRATFFAVARDAAGAEGARWYRRVVAEGHEVANHSDRHPLAFRHLPRRQKAAEIDGAHRRLEDAIGQPVVGFRAPAYDLDDEILELLLERGYRYDSSLYPTPFLVAMKVLVQLRARRRRVGLGTWRHLLADRAPHFVWRDRGRLRTGRRPPGPAAGPSLVELPLAVVPGLRLPLYGTVTQAFGVGAFRAALALLRRGRLPVNYAIHAYELAGGDSSVAAGAGGGGAVPGYGASVERRAAVLRRSLQLLAAGSRPVTLAELAAEVAAAAAPAPASAAAVAVVDPGGVRDAGREGAA